jgi:glucose/arabinose dehydrogenase
MPRRPLTSAALVLAAVALAGCASASPAPPNWRPQQSETLEPGQGPQVSATPQSPDAPGQPVPGAPSGSAPSSATGDPAIVATNLTTPQGIAILPDGSALVGERTTGQIVHVQAQAGQPAPVVRTLAGLDASGDGGLLALALSPTYPQDKLIYAYVTTPTDNRVIDFTLSGALAPVLTGIPKGSTDNAGQLAFDPAGNLLVGTGDAGQPALAAEPASLAGKVLRITAIGAPVSGTSPVFTRGHRAVSGLCVDPSAGTDFETEPRSGAVPDKVNVLQAGADYGWPAATATSVAPAAQIPAAEGGIGGCAVSGPRLYVTSLDAKSLLSASIGGQTPPTLVSFSASLVGKYGRLLSVAAAPDGSLWLTTTNKDGHGAPIATDDRVIHLPDNAGGSSSKA